MKQVLKKAPRTSKPDGCNPSGNAIAHLKNLDTISLNLGQVLRVKQDIKGPLIAMALHLNEVFSLHGLFSLQAQATRREYSR